MSWLMVKAASPPPARSHHSACLVGTTGNMLLFGGWNGTRYLNDLYLLEKGTRWTMPDCKGCIPSPRSQHSAITFRNKIVVFGGFDGENYLEDVYVLEPETWTWQAIKTGGSQPGGRCGHTATLIGGKEMWILGGKFSARGFCDFHEFFVLDLETWNWERRTAKGAPEDGPSARAWHTTTIVGNKENFYVFGGKSQNEVFNDLYVFSTATTKRWTRVSTSGTPSPRACHAALALNELLIVFGGENSMNAKKPEIHNDIYVLFIDSMQWRVPLVTFGSTVRGAKGEEAAAYTQHAAVMLSKSKIAVFGGIRQDFVKESRAFAAKNVYCSDLLLLYHLEKLAELNSRFVLENPKKFLKDKKADKREKKRLKKEKDALKEKEKKYAKGAEVNTQVRLLRSSTVGDSGIGLPFNLQHNVHVDLDWNWSGKAEDVFEVQEKLGEGAYGAVYKGVQRETGFVLAIKEIFQGGNYEDLKREIEILKTCKNRNVVCYYGTATTVDQSLWILMDYCSAGSVRDMIEVCEAALTEEQVAFVCREALMGLLYLHARKIIHRDVKAANILLDSEGTVKIADFGVSQQLSEHSVSERIGTPLWMAPEVMQGRKYNERCDIWSLGITAIEMADGLPPNSNLNASRAMRLIPSQPPPTLEDPSEWTELFNEFVAACLVKEPDSRPNAAELLPHKFLTTAKGPEIIKQRIEECMLIKVAKKAKKEEEKKLKTQQLQQNSGNDEGAGSGAFSTLVASGEADDSGEVRYPTVAAIDDADNDNYSTMVVSDGNEGDDGGGDGYSTMVVNDGEGNEDDGGGDGYSTMVVRGKDDGDGDGGDAFSTTVLKDENEDGDADGGDAFSTTVVGDGKEEGQYKARYGGGGGGAGGGGGGSTSQFAEAVRRAGSSPAPVKPPPPKPRPMMKQQSREEMLSVLGGGGPIIVPGSPGRSNAGGARGAATISPSGGPYGGGRTGGGPSPHARSAMPGLNNSSPTPTTQPLTVARKPVVTGAPPPVQPFNISTPPPTSELPATPQQQQPQQPPKGGSGIKTQVDLSKLNSITAGSAGELIEKLKPVLAQMIEEEVERRVSRELENLKKEILANLTK